MLDTIRFWQKYKLVSAQRHVASGHWRTVDKASGLRIRGKNGMIDAVEVSLPRALFGTNDRLITSQAELDRAFGRVEAILRKIAKPQETRRNFTRIDLVWHFRGNPADFILAHRECNHPDVSKKIGIYRTKRRARGVEWKGSLMKVKLYDKTKWHLKRPLWIVRVEVQLRGRKLRHEFKRDPLSEIDFDECYRIYRTIIVKLQPKAVPQLSSKDELLFLADMQGIPVLDHLAKTTNPKTVQRFRARRNQFVFEELKINWDQRLPKTHPPTAWAATEMPKIRLRLVPLQTIRQKRTTPAQADLPRTSI